MLIISIALDLALICLTLLAMARVDGTLKALRREKAKDAREKATGAQKCAEPENAAKGGETELDRCVAAILAYSGKPKEQERR